MGEVKITDLVDQETIDKIKELDSELKTLLNTYTNTARELAKGIDINVRVVGDLDKLEKLYADKTKEAAAATERLNSVMNEQKEVLYATTPVLARNLMEQERVNKTQRETYTEYGRVKKLLEEYNGSYADHLRRIVELNAMLSQNSQHQKENEKNLKAGIISMAEYQNKQIQLIEKHRMLSQEKRSLQQIMTAEEKSMQTADTSYVQMSQQLELLKKAYKDLGAEARESEMGREMENAIQNLDAHLKDVAADMGEFQRNVGNYAIAGQKGVVTTNSVIAAINQEAITTQDLIDQTKILEEAKAMLDKKDANYQATMDSLNAKLEENTRKLTDVSDIMEKEAHSVAEAEAQNKRLQEALKHVDLTSDDAQQRVQELNEKISANTRLIKENTPAIEDQTKALEQQEKANEGLADNLLELAGLNSQFGSSLKGLENAGTGNVIDGLNTKVKAFGNTLMGLLANPWVLAFLGIAGVAAGFKWWYEYNKGLVEATKRTQDLTGLSGDGLKAVRNEVQAVADTYGKDFQETLEAANALSKQFGISFQEAIGLVKDGFVAGADANGEFLDNLKEYPTYFKEAGVSAEAFIAITAQANQAGIYSDKGIDVIKEGNLRIREMTKATAEALDGIGISSKEVQESLANGSKTTFEIMQEISEKLAEFPESSSEVGTALADIFGGPGEDAGLQYILTLKDIDTNLDKVKGRAGELGKLQEEQLRSQVELENAIASVFDATGGSFESMTTNAKIFVNKGIVTIIKGCVEIVNWFVEIYNEAEFVRVCMGALVAIFKSLWSVAEGLFELLANGFKGTGGMIEGLMMILSGKIDKGITKIKDSFTEGFKGIKNTLVSTAAGIGNAFVDELSNVTQRRLRKVDLGLNANISVSESESTPKKISGYTPKESDEDKKKREKAAKDAEKTAKEELKRINELEEAKISVMEEGHEKELAMIRLNFKKKMDEITGNGETETALRLQLAEQCQSEISKCELKYQTELSKINLENRLAAAEKGSKEELDLKLAQLEASRAAEIEAAGKTGADLALINEKFNRQREDLENEYAASAAQRITERYAVEAIARDTAYSNSVNALKARYAEEIKAAGQNSDKRQEIEDDLQNRLVDIENEYAQKTGESTIDMIGEILNLEKLSAEDRLKWEQELAKAKISLNNKVADSHSDSVKRQISDDEKLRDKKLKNVQGIIDKVKESLGAINGLMSAVYDGQIEKIEANQEALEEASEAEKGRIDSLVEQNVITQEEGEARKRAAEERTEKKTEELEKKKAQIKYKQAVFDKALSVANIGMNTAMALMELWVKPGWPAAIPMMAVVGALGALQLATVLATPIPKYKAGTGYHPGGAAIVGDGGKHEVVLFGNEAWITPDKPTLVDLPKGASVIPDITEYGDDIVNMTEIPPSQTAPRVIVNNDYRKLEEKMDKVIYLFRNLYNFRKDSETEQYLELVKLQKGL